MTRAHERAVFQRFSGPVTLAASRWARRIEALGAETVAGDMDDASATGADAVPAARPEY